MALTKEYELKINYRNDRYDYDQEFQEHFPEFEGVITKYASLPDAYIMVNTIEATKSSLSFAVIVYKDDSKEVLIKRERHTFTPDVSSDTTPNFFAQAYEYLKRLPEYKNAVDC